MRPLPEALRTVFRRTCSDLSDRLLRPLLSGGTRAALYEGLAAHLDNGLRLLDALDLLRRRAGPTHVLRRRFPELLRQRLAAGASLPQALDGLIPDEERMIIAGGTDAGRQAETLRLAAELVGIRRKIADEARKSLSYPTVLCLLFLGLLLTVSLFVMPRLADLADPTGWPGMARGLYTVSTFVDSGKGLAAGAALLLAAAAVGLSLSRWTGRARVWADEIPPWSLYRLLKGGMWFLTLSTLLRGGVRTARALEMMQARAAFSPWLHRRARAVYLEYQQGKDLGRALADTGYNFPDRTLVEEFRLYSSLPDFHGRLGPLTRQWLDQGLARFARTCRFLSGASILAVLLLLTGVGVAVSDLIGLLGRGNSLF